MIVVGEFIATARHFLQGNKGIKALADFILLYSSVRTLITCRQQNSVVSGVCLVPGTLFWYKVQFLRTIALFSGVLPE